MLSVQNLLKVYETRSGEPSGGAFDVSFDVGHGELFTLLGPSGCGKTTTLRSIAGLETPDSGVISLDGENIFDGRVGRSTPMYDRDIGMVFQSYAIWPHMSVFENAAYPLRVQRQGRLAREEIETRVVRVLEMVGLAKYRSRSATQLSGGQQQRLALARALAREPKLLLLDEPLSNLDAQLREHMRAELKRIQSQWGVTTVYVTHDQAEAMAISDRIAVLNQGKLMQVGTAEQIYEQPTSEFVASFIGRTNLLSGRLRDRVEAGGFGIVESDVGPVRCKFRAAVSAGASVRFVARPEDVQCFAGGDGRGENMLHGKVLSRVYLGDIVEYAINVGSITLLVRSHPSVSLRKDDIVRVHLPAERTIAIYE
ncbi:MAG: ABC transporter ATP-binding protein [Beijerinckiaceae bacterium]